MTILASPSRLRSIRLYFKLTKKRRFVGVPLQLVFESVPGANHHLFFHFIVDVVQRYAKKWLIWKEGMRPVFKGFLFLVPIAVLLFDDPALNAVSRGFNNSAVDYV